MSETTPTSKIEFAEVTFNYTANEVKKVLRASGVLKNHLIRDIIFTVILVLSGGMFMQRRQYWIAAIAALFVALLWVVPRYLEKDIIDSAADTSEMTVRITPDRVTVDNEGVVLELPLDENCISMDDGGCLIFYTERSNIIALTPRMFETPEEYEWVRALLVEKTDFMGGVGGDTADGSDAAEAVKQEKESDGGDETNAERETEQDAETGAETDEADERDEADDDSDLIEGYGLTPDEVERAGQAQEDEAAEEIELEGEPSGDESDQAEESGAGTAESADEEEESKENGEDGE